MKPHLFAALLILGIAHPVHAAEELIGREEGPHTPIQPKFKTATSSLDPAVKDGARIALGDHSKSGGKAAGAKAAAATEDASMAAPPVPRSKVVAGNIQKRPMTPAALAKQRATSLPKTPVSPIKHNLPEPAATVATNASPGTSANLHHAQPHSNGLNAAAPVQQPKVSALAVQQPKSLTPVPAASVQPAKPLTLASAFTPPAPVFKPVQAAQSLGGPAALTAHHSANPAMIGGAITPSNKKSATTGMVALGRL